MMQSDGSKIQQTLASFGNFEAVGNASGVFAGVVEGASSDWAYNLKGQLTGLFYIVPVDTASLQHFTAYLPAQLTSAISRARAA